MIKKIFYKRIDNNKYEFWGIIQKNNFFINGNNKKCEYFLVNKNEFEFKQKGAFFSLPFDVSCPIFCKKFCVHGGYIDKLNNKLILEKDFKVFVECVHFSHKEKYIICIQNNVIGMKLIKDRLIWIIDKVMDFCIRYLGLSSPEGIIFRLFYDLNSIFDINLKMFFIDLKFFPFPEKLDYYYKEFKENLRYIIKKMILLVFGVNGYEYSVMLNGFVSLVCLYFERIYFNNENELMYMIYKDYKTNRNKSMYFYIYILNDNVKSNEPLLSLFYLNVLKGLFLVKPFGSINKNRIEKMFHKKYQTDSYIYNDYPVLKINVEEIDKDHVFYLKITINQQNGNWFRGSLECMIHERTGVNKLYCLVSGNTPTVLYYNCRGILNKLRKKLEKRQTEVPDKIFSFIEFNYNGKLPCFLIVDSVNQKMLNDCRFWTKMVCLDNIKDKPNFLYLRNLINNVFFNEFNDTKNVLEGYFKLLKPLCKFLFNSNSFMNYINYNIPKNRIYNSNPKIINFAIGVYKKLFKINGKYIYKQPIVNNLYNPIQYNLRKALLKQISLCHVQSEQKKIFIFFREVFEDFDFQKSKDFYFCLEKCVKNNKSLLLLKKKGKKKKWMSF